MLWQNTCKGRSLATGGGLHRLVGVVQRLVGWWPLVGRWLLGEVGQPPVVVGQRLVLVGQPLVVVGQRLVVVGQLPVVVGQRLVVVGQLLVVVGQWLVAMGQWLVVAGQQLGGQWLACLQPTLQLLPLGLLRGWQCRLQPWRLPGLDRGDTLEGVVDQELVALRPKEPWAMTGQEQGVQRDQQPRTARPLPLDDGSRRWQQVRLRSSLLAGEGRCRILSDCARHWSGQRRRSWRSTDERSGYRERGGSGRWCHSRYPATACLGRRR